VCADDPLTIFQNSTPISNGHPKYDFLHFQKNVW
jgi:hypothetical protein